MYLRSTRTTSLLTLAFVALVAGCVTQPAENTGDTGSTQTVTRTPDDAPIMLARSGGVTLDSDAYPAGDGSFYTVTNGWEVTRVLSDGTTEVVVDSEHRVPDLRAWDGKLYLLKSPAHDDGVVPEVHEYEVTADGLGASTRIELEDIEPRSESGLGLAVGAERIAVLSNRHNDVRIFSDSGESIKTVVMEEASEVGAQNVSGVFVEQDRLLVSEDGHGNAMLVRIDDGVALPFTEIDGDWIGHLVLDEAGSTAYVARQPASIIRFSAHSPAEAIFSRELVADLSNVPTGFTVHPDSILFVSYHGDGFFEFDPSTEQVEQIAELDNPTSLAFIPDSE